MFRALLELFITTVAIIVARAILNSVMSGLKNASRTYPQQQARGQGQDDGQQSGDPSSGKSRQQSSQAGSELHKDPVCGTYVVEMTPFRRQAAGQTFYYCSEACREKHAFVTR